MKFISLIIHISLFGKILLGQPFPINKTINLNFRANSNIIALRKVDPLKPNDYSHKGKEIKLLNTKFVRRLLVSGRVKANAMGGSFSIIAITAKGKEFLVVTSNDIPFTENGKWVDFNDKGYNTQVLNNERIVKLVVAVNGVELKLTKVKISESERFNSIADYYSIKKSIFDSLRNAHSVNLLNQTKYWKADITTNLSLHDIDDDINALDCERGAVSSFKYYCGGLYMVSDVIPSIVYDTLPESLDYRNFNGKNFVSSIKLQRAGDCVFQSYAALAESKLMLQRNDTVMLDISEQAMQNSPNPNRLVQEYPQSFKEIVNKQGLYYDNKWEMAKSMKVKARLECSVDTILTIPTDNISLKSALHQYGPISVSYLEGILNHAMLLVGYGIVHEGDTFCLSEQSMYLQKYIRIEAGSPLIGQTYWIVKNSWGTQWGDKGFCYMLATKDLFAKAFAISRIVD